MKMRLFLGPNGREVCLMRKIVQIRWGDQWYVRADYDHPLALQRFYETIRDHKLEVQQVIYRKGETILNDHYLHGELHCVYGPARQSSDLEGAVLGAQYVIRGRLMGEAEWLLHPDVIRGQREYKLQRILK